MYNEKIEALIKAALADGELTEKEKQVLFRRAQEQGIDLDEFEMVLDARLVELKKSKQTVAPKSNKSDDVKKCPVCGDSIATSIGVCPSCGHVFSKVDNISLLKELRDNYQLFYDAKDISPLGKVLKVLSFPIVAILLLYFFFFVILYVMFSKTTIKDILSYFKIQSGEKRKYIAKHQALMIQIRHTYAMDKEVMEQANDIDALFSADKKKNMIITITSFIIITIIALIIYISCAISAFPEKQFSKLVSMQQYDKAYELITNDPQLITESIRDNYVKLTNMMIRCGDLDKSTYLMNNMDKMDLWSSDYDEISSRYFYLCLENGQIHLAVEHIKTLEQAISSMLYYINNKENSKAISIYHKHKDLFYHYDNEKSRYVYTCDNIQITSFLKKNNISLASKQHL